MKASRVFWVEVDLSRELSLSSRPSGECIHPGDVMERGVQNVFAADPGPDGWEAAGSGLVPVTRRGAEELYIAPPNVRTMGSYVLYLLMQAFVTMIFAYFSGTLALQSRKLPTMLVSAGFYLIMGSALLELWGDRGGWEAWALGLNAALVATSVALIGGGILLMKAPGMPDPSLADSLAKLFIVGSALMGAALAASAGSSSAVVDPKGATGIEISGTFTHLGPVGWVLGAPLLIGAVLLVWMGIRTAFVRSEVREAWFVGSGALFLVWPFDLHVGGVPLGPSILMLAVATTYFGNQPPKGQEDVPEGEREEPEGPDDDDGNGDLAPWVREAIAAHAAEHDGENGKME
jgi:hypothetical protein